MGVVNAAHAQACGLATSELPPRAHLDPADEERAALALAEKYLEDWGALGPALPASVAWATLRPAWTDAAYWSAAPNDVAPKCVPVADAPPAIAHSH